MAAKENRNQPSTTTQDGRRFANYDNDLPLEVLQADSIPAPPSGNRSNRQSAPNRRTYRQFHVEDSESNLKLVGHEITNSKFSTTAILKSRQDRTSRLFDEAIEIYSP